MKYSIEEGLFILTMMPSLRCSLNCPHCYLSKEQRRNSEVMSLENIEKACSKVNEYYQSRSHITEKTIVCYWYGGEPTEMGIEYMENAFSVINATFSKDRGCTVKHIVLTSLLTIDDIWFKFFRDHCNGEFQTSFDGLMRGKGYVRKWEKRVKQAIDFGLSVSTLSVINSSLIETGGRETLDYLTDLGVSDVGFLPFMLNDQNEGAKYERFSPTMDAFSDFMIDLGERWIEKKSAGLAAPLIGQVHFVLGREGAPNRANVAGQTLFLMPNGEMSLPDYRDGHHEYLRPFGNILEESFSDILTGRERRNYLRKQVTRNRNPECVKCDKQNQCLMEFWKQNKPGECFGAARFVDWARNNISIKEIDRGGDLAA